MPRVLARNTLVGTVCAVTRRSRSATRLQTELPMQLADATTVGASLSPPNATRYTELTVDVAPKQSPSLSRKRRVSFLIRSQYEVPVAIARAPYARAEVWSHDYAEVIEASQAE